MRKMLAAKTLAAALTLAAATAASAQFLPPALPAAPAAPAPPPIAPAVRNDADAPAAHYHARAAQTPGFDPEEEMAAAALRLLLRERGLGADVLGGPMAVVPPGSVGAFSPGHDPELDAPLSVGPHLGAFLVQTGAGRWWVWEYGAVAPADQRAAVHDAHARRAAPAEGRSAD
jgi:hypothetical protein